MNGIVIVVACIHEDENAGKHGEPVSKPSGPITDATMTVALQNHTG